MLPLSKPTGSFCVSPWPLRSSEPNSVLLPHPGVPGLTALLLGPFSLTPILRCLLLFSLRLLFANQRHVLCLSGWSHHKCFLSVLCCAGIGWNLWDAEPWGMDRRGDTQRVRCRGLGHLHETGGSWEHTLASLLGQGPHLSPSAPRATGVKTSCVMQTPLQRAPKAC